MIGCFFIISSNVSIIKKRITPVRDGNFKRFKDVNINVKNIIKKRITPVRDGNYDRLFFYYFI